LPKAEISRQWWPVVNRKASLNFTVNSTATEGEENFIFNTHKFSLARAFFVYEIFIVFSIFHGDVEREIFCFFYEHFITLLFSLFMNEKARK
jgi:hypothetical protein